jgi:hypothetical protein
MKRIAVTALLVLSGFVLSGFFMGGNALAQTTHEVRVNVPFDFAVGNKVLPAGNYSIDSEATAFSPNEVLIQNTDQHQISVLVRTSGNPAESQPLEVASRGSLVFDQYGGQHFLREIRGPVAAVNAEIPISTAEQNAQRNEGTALSSVNQSVVPLR